MTFNYETEAFNFINEKNYRLKGRNWGNSWHSLCSYRGKLKPAIAAELVNRFSKKNDIVLDPMGGVGTIALEANIQGRIGISNDLSKLAQVVTRAKLNPPSLNEVEKELTKLQDFIEANKENFTNNIEVTKFGLNGKISDYYHPQTLLEILAARDYFLSSNLSAEQNLILACVLHILHGNRPYALSRTSHPLTPYAPKGEFIYKNLIEHTIQKVHKMYNSKDFFLWNNGNSYNYDILELPSKINEYADIIITSPPFASSFKFYTQNWLRLWFSGWSPLDFQEAKNLYFDEKQNKDMNIYYNYFSACSKLLKPDGRMILHLGKSSKFDMANELIERCGEWFNVIFVGSEDVKTLENHGITDKGATQEHQFVFLEKK